MWVTLVNADAQYQRLWGSFEPQGSSLECLIPGTEVRGVVLLWCALHFPSVLRRVPPQRACTAAAVGHARHGAVGRGRGCGGHRGPAAAQQDSVLGAR